MRLLKLIAKGFRGILRQCTLYSSTIIDGIEAGLAD